MTKLKTKKCYLANSRMIGNEAFDSFEVTILYVCSAMTDYAKLQPTQ